MSWFSAARARLHLLFAPRAAESRMNEEFDFHIEMETARLVREEHLSAHEARRRALATFGGVTQHKEELREGRGLAQPLRETGVYPQLAIQLIQVGEETGRLEEMLGRVADIYDVESSR